MNLEPIEKDAHWVQKADLKKGAFASKASKAGKTTAQYAAQVLKKDSGASAKTKKQATLTRTFSKMRHK
jgi:hypothetical protein